MKFQPLIGTDLSGHIGGIVASHNTYGPYFRKRVKPVQPRTIYQMQQRAALGYLSQSWRHLDPTVRAAWIAAELHKHPRKGGTVTLTGQAAYMYINLLRRRIGVTLITSPPTSDPPVALTLPILNLISATQFELTFGADDWNAADGGVIVSAKLLTSSGVSYGLADHHCAVFNYPGLSPILTDLPFALPIGANARLTFHATDPAGRQSTYVTEDLPNPSFPPPFPSPLSVVSVTKVGTKIFLWLFNGPVTVTPGADANLVVNGDPTGVAAADGPNGVLVTYTTANAASLPWTLAAQPLTITEPIAVPDSGLTV